LLAAAVVKISPRLARLPLAAFDIKAPRFVPELSAAIAAHWLLAIAIGAANAAIGYILVRTHAGVAKLAAATAAGVTCLSMAAYVYVLPATANTITVKGFAIQATHIIGSGKAAYLWGLNYDFAFYSGMTIPVVPSAPKLWPEYLILGDTTYQALSEHEMSDYAPVLTGSPTSLDGTGSMILAHRKPG
jgi:hypothetical protein